MDKEVLLKSATIEKSTASQDDLALINAYALRELTADEVFVFSVILCGNSIDRTFERFTDKGLEDLARLYIGKTVIKDHTRRADGQIARIFDTELTAPDAAGYRQLLARCYMVRTESNADFIREIEGGIKREGSVSFSPEKYVCGVCGQDNMKELCLHFPGRRYKKNGEETLCVFAIDGVTDCYEFSLVAVPAQPEAGVCKCFKDALNERADKDTREASCENAANINGENSGEIAKRIVAARIRVSENTKK